MEKETEEKTSKRVCDIVAEKHYNNSYRNLSAQDKFLLTFEISKLYHSERIKQLAPSKLKVIELSKNWTDMTVHIDADPYSFIKGFETAIELLTKGE